MGKLFAILGATLYYFLYPFIILIIVLGPLMEYDYLTDIYELEAPRNVLGIGGVCFFGFLLLLSYRVKRLGWLYRKVPVFLPFLQMCFIMLVGFEFALFFANLWADKGIFGKGCALTLSILSILLARAYLSYWYTKYPISYKVHKL